MFNPNIITEVSTASSIRRRFEQLSAFDDLHTKTFRRNFTSNKNKSVIVPESKFNVISRVKEQKQRVIIKSNPENENENKIKNQNFQQSLEVQISSITKSLKSWIMLPILDSEENGLNSNECCTSDNNSNASEAAIRVGMNSRALENSLHHACDNLGNFEIVDKSEQIIMGSSKRGKIISMLPNERDAAHLGQVICHDLNEAVVKELNLRKQINTENLYEDIEFIDDMNIEIKSTNNKLDQINNPNNLIKFENFQINDTPLMNSSTMPLLIEISSSLKSLEPQDSEFSSSDNDGSIDNYRRFDYSSSCGRQKHNHPHAAEDVCTNGLKDGSDVSISINIIASRHGKLMRRKTFSSERKSRPSDNILSTSRLSEPLEFQNSEKHFPLAEKRNGFLSNHKTSSIAGAIDDLFDFLNRYE